VLDHQAGVPDNGVTQLGAVVAMTVLIFLIGALLGLTFGVIGCIRYVRQELTARIGPTMDLMQLQLDNVQSAVNLALATWHAELHGHGRIQEATLSRSSDKSSLD
jgi:hypothetical protein